MLRRFLLRIIFNALALYLLTIVLAGVSFRGNWKSYLIAGLIFAVINSLIKPVIKLLTLPIIALTLGLFTIIINMAMLWLLTKFTPDLYIAGFFTYFFATIIISIFNFLASPFFKKQE